jgi:ferritin
MEDRFLIGAKVEKALNDQINAELYSAYLYLAMSAYFQSISLNGFASWMQVQAQEEVGHAMKMYAFLQDRDGTIELQAIDAPEKEWDSPLAAFGAALAHEQKVTALIGSLVEISVQEKDHAAQTFLQWFVTEQVEEEATAGDIVGKLKLVGNEGNGLFLMDGELAQRQAAPDGEAEAE